MSNARKARSRTPIQVCGSDRGAPSPGWPTSSTKGGGADAREERLASKLGPIQIEVSSGGRGVRASVTLAAIHRKPRKRPHVVVKAPCGSGGLGEAQGLFPGEYLAISEVAGYRPMARTVQIGSHGKRIRIDHAKAARLLPGEDPQTLIHRGESHHFVPLARQFLTHFGYVSRAGEGAPEAAQKSTLDDGTSEGIRRYQRFFRLRETGTITIETLLLMLQPRCACPDFQASSAGPTGVTAGDPIAFMGDRWDAQALTYRTIRGTPDMGNEDAVIDAAFRTWAAHAALSFRRAAAPTDFTLDFLDFADGAAYPFDGPAGKHASVLAHAWGPQSGRIEFDDEEPWNDGTWIGGGGGFGGGGPPDFYLGAVAVHEIGHALGLAHSNVAGATMFPTYRWDQVALDEVDVRGIRSLYPPIVRSDASFVTVPLFAIGQFGGTQTVRIDLGSNKRFLAWGTMTMIDSLAQLDRDNFVAIDVYEIDGNRTGFSLANGDHYGSATSPANVFQGAVVGFGRTVTFRMSCGHSADLEAMGMACVLVLTGD